MTGWSHDWREAVEEIEAECAAPPDVPSSIDAEPPEWRRVRAILIGLIAVVLAITIGMLVVGAHLSRTVQP